MTDCVLKRLYDQNLSGAEDLELVCGKKRAVGEFTACVCISVCVGSSEPLQVVSTPWHRMPLLNNNREGRQREEACGRACVCVPVCWREARALT